MHPAPMITIFPLIFMGLVLALAIGVSVALAFSKIGRCVLAFGGFGLLAFAGLFGYFFLQARRSEQVVATRAGESITLEEFAPARPPRAPIAPRVTLEAERVVNQSIDLAESSPPAAAPPTETAAPSADTAAPSGETALGTTSAPIRKIKAGAARPAWMDEPTGKRGDEFRTIATAGPYATPQECHQKLNDAIRVAITTYVDHHLSNRSGVEIELPSSFVHNELVRGEWLEQSEYSFGPMYNLHAHLVFDKTANDAIDRQFHDSQVQGRLASAGAGAGLVLALIGTLFGYLKLDTLTRGYYTGRLRVAAGAAILALAAVAGLLAQGNIGF